MAKGYVAKEFSSLSPQFKGVIAIVILGGVAFVGYKIYQGIKKSQENKDNRIEDKEWDNEFYKQTSKPTLSAAEMQSMSKQLFVAMDGYGTDEEAVLSVFNKMKNDADFAGVVSVYGTKELSSGTLNPEPNYKGNLLGALTSELSSSWLKKINTSLSSKGIKYRV